MWSWDFFYNLIIALATIGLLSVGGYLAWKGRTHAKWVLVFAFLFAVLLVCSRFKHVKGFGFEAEMWDQKQIEAAALIDRLTLLSESTAQQTGLIAARLGFMDSGLTNPQLAELLAQTEKTLTAVGTSKSKRDELTAPVINRIKWNYISDAKGFASQAYKREINETDNSISTVNSDTRDSLIAKSLQLKKVLQKIDNLPLKPLFEANNLNPLIDIVRASPSIDTREKLLETLSELDDDLRFFATNLRLRRNINLDYLYK